MLQRIIILFSISCILACPSKAQELNCQVSVLTPSIQASDRTIYQTLERNIREFINNRKWTGDNYLNQERIECSMIITIASRNNDEFTADLQLQSRRPGFKSSYNTTLLNLKDNDFSFRYIQDQVLEYNEGANTYGLTNLLAYYAYIILAFDYDSYALEGGTPYFQKAQNIVANSQQAGEKGWRAFESQRNRYWITENALNVSFKPLRECLYKYHRLGIDLMSDKLVDGRRNISECFMPLKRTYQDRPNSYLMQIFFIAKSDEIVSIFSQGMPDEKNTVVPILSQIDPGNINKYNTIVNGR
ncbi:MAG: hypothetical protein RIQ89_2104 [Bacteroidota bacterium]|jgi:hypothetical protein